MASAVNVPSADAVVAITGLSELVTGASESDFLLALGPLITSAEAECAIAVGEAYFDRTDHTARKAALLGDAVAFRAARRALNVPWLQKVTGTHEPLLMEDASQIGSVRDDLLAEAERLEGLAVAGIETGGSAGDRRPFGLPAVACSTFTPRTSDRTPLDRLRLTDETDNISSFDTEHG